MENQQSLDRHLLHVIKASAGSGKTHRLTGEYLRLLFSAPNNHRHILAVTFTNKATDEMKSRIVEELYRLASGADSSYLAELMDDFSMRQEDVRTKAKTVLETILHDYSSFSISTIDRFFQQTMRTFAREIGLAGGYNIELDETSLLTETIDLMLSELDKPENKTLAEWLLRFMQHNIEEGKSWKIDRQVLDLAKQLFNETYKSFTDEEQSTIQDKEQLEAYKQMLMRIVKSYENEVKSIGVKALSIMQQYGLSYDDFKHKRNSGFLLFTKLAGGNVEKPSTRLIALADNIDLWYSGKEKENAIRSAYSDGLNECVKQIIYLSDNDREYQTAKHLLRNFYTLGILNDIKQRLRKLQQENNTLFLSDTTELLNDIIAGTDSPFIYEKTGTRVHHYMIDEFQDTSRMQWENFRPLIGESLASGNLNLIVGDVKQSIYRFRNSDWRLLEEQVKEDFQADNIREHVLDTNWRSDAHIVQFNNAFFTKAAINLQNDFNTSSESPQHTEGGGNNGHNIDTQITNAYADLYQQVPPKKADSGGQVRITFLKDDKETDWKADVLERLPQEIEALQDQGFALKDIAIVVRWNHEAVQVAETLLSYREQHPESPYRYDIISNEALLVRSAQSVKAIIALMRHFRNPKDEICRMMAIYEFYRFQRRSSPDEALQFYREEGHGDFPDEIKGHLGELVSMPFYEMTEHFFTLTTDALDAKENAYVQAFLDIVLKFKESATADLNDFLDWWDETGHRKALFSPEDQDAIRLITIHKSKGLGFGAVIMPFVSWGMDHNTYHNDIIWCKPGSAPFNALGVAPLKYGKGLEDTIFRDSYLEEKRFTYIDNLNLLYVAFTRPKHRLIAFAPIPRKPETISDAADLLWRSITDTASLPDLEPTATIPADPEPPASMLALPEPTASKPSASRKNYIPLSEYFSEGETESVFEYGKPETVRKPEEKAVADSDKTGKWHSVPFGDRLQLRFNSIGYFSDDGSRDYGTMMHDIVSNVKTLADIPQAVEQKVSAGELAEEERENTIHRLTEILSRPEISDWYSGKYTILNETQVLHPDTGFSRPDRVMIGPDEVIVADYKFGETEETKYIRQVQRYVKPIQEMGYENVSGYVFYVKSGKIVECPLPG
ncbi:ATP-dependent exoDNAse (exonuclease V) beta subunit (contains helicase and exonuclease domains) [Porphyromonadaceae bacterium NLAE-zl-C104]|nr:ATP-dependent exoDNAse (exonuclease V) beta subunit (contains helicase and exonuclease domains) [Porphyromonadaceae bacterium NLAE-zl-C104]